MIKAYLKDHIAFFSLYLGTVIIYAIICFLYYFSWELFFYGLTLFTMLFLIISIYNYNKYKGKIIELGNLQKTLATTLDEMLKTDRVLENEYIEIINNLIKEIKVNLNDNQIKHQETMDYFTTWVHQVKVPLSTILLLLENPQTDSFLIKGELLKLQQYIKMVLSYLRLEDAKSDYVFKQYKLDPIIRETIRQFSTIFIAKKIKLNFQETNKEVLTDNKWLGFVLEQLLSNAVKYTNQGEIRIYYQDDKLIIEDQGTGIAPEDLYRIFEKGYTGYNGHNSNQASGLGLYLVKKTLDKLGHKIKIESVVGTGTKVILDLKHYLIIK